ncbi:cyclase family protein, partial [Streptomyces sp. 7R007]
MDRTDPEGAIAEAAKSYSNWGRWGEEDVLGTLNFLD